MRQNVVETIIGAVVIAVAGGFLFLAYKSTGLNQSNDGYEIMARFQAVDGLSLGSDVRIGGIKVGTVSSMELDPDSYDAMVGLELHAGIKVPEDSSASIIGDGLLGGKYVSIMPGGMDPLPEGGVIEITQPAVSLETLIGKMIYSGGGVDDAEEVGDSLDDEDEMFTLPGTSLE